jgi:hypothetical protein
MQSREGGQLPSGALPPVTQESSETKRQRERSAGEWAALLAARVASVGPVALYRSSEPQGHVGTVTPPLVSPSTSPTESQPADTASATAAGPNRFVAEISAGDLGSITLVLEHDASGSRVFVAGSEATKSLISADKFSLEQALSHAGVRVTQLSIVSRKELGTVLAEGSKRGTRSEYAGHSSAAQPSAGSRRRRLNMIG